MADKVTVRIDGDASGAVHAFDKAGSSAKSMSADLSGAVDSSEGKFRGLGDTVAGTGDVMDGFRTGNVAQMAMGMADLAGGIKDFIIPAITAMSTALKTQLGTAMTFISAHPLVAALLAAGAIIVGLVLLEKKFGIVTKAINFVKEALTDVWDWIKNNWDDLANILTAPWRTVFNFIAKGWNETAGKIKFEVPSWVPGIGGKGFSVPNIPMVKFHTGGIAGRDTMAFLQQGERVIPRGQPSGMALTVNVSGVGMGRDFGMAVAQAIRDNKLIGLT